MRRPIVLICMSTALGILVCKKLIDGLCRPGMFLAFAVLLFIVALFAIFYYIFKEKSCWNLSTACNLSELNTDSETGEIIEECDFRRAVRVAMAAAVAFIFGIGIMLAAENLHCVLYDNAGETVEVCGVIIDSEEAEPGAKYKLLVRTDDGSRILITMYGSITGMKHYETVGRSIEAECEIELPQGRRNPNCFDYGMYLRSKRIEVVASVKPDEVSIGGTAGGVYYDYLNKIAVFKGRFGESLAERCGAEKSGIICAMLFGDKELIDEDMYKTFQQNGTAHILSVSGLHVGAVYAAFVMLLGGKRRKAVCIAAAAFLCVYAAMASFAPSVVRAVAMIYIHMLSQLTNRRYDMLCAASFCMLVTFVRNPYMLFNTGFQLSYLAVLSISVIGSALKQKLGTGDLLPLISVNLGMMPITAYAFNYFSLGSLIANIPVVLITGLIVPFGMLLMIILPVTESVLEIAGSSAAGNGFIEVICSMLAPAFDIAADIFVKIPVILCDIAVYINELTYSEGLLTFDVVSPPVFAIAIYYGIVFGACTDQFIVWRQRKRWDLLLVLAILLVLAAALLGLLFETGFEEADFVFVDVGQGDCLHIRAENGGNYLVDGGGSLQYDVADNTLKPYLLKNGVRKVDIAFVTHLHTDHYEGIAALCREGMVRKLCLYDGNRINEDEILKETNMESEDIIYISEGDKVVLDKQGSAYSSKSKLLRGVRSAKEDTTTIEVLSPPKRTEAEYAEIFESDDENASSLILKIVQGDMSILMTGDIGSEAERELIAQHGRDLNSTILKAAHHGSRFSSCDEFIETVDPQVMIFQVGKNNYGHPHKTIIEKCEEKGIMVYRNDEDGAVGIETGGKGFIVTTVR